MKTIITLSFLLLAMTAGAQVCRTTATDHSRVIIGATGKPSAALIAGLFNARFDLGQNEIALIAGHPCVQAYYAVYDEDYHFITCGAVAKVKEGEYDIVKVGRPAEKCHVMLSVTPFIAQN